MKYLSVYHLATFVIKKVRSIVRFFQSRLLGHEFGQEKFFYRCGLRVVARFHVRLALFDAIWLYLRDAGRRYRFRVAISRVQFGSDRAKVVRYRRKNADNRFLTSPNVERFSRRRDHTPCSEIVS